MGSPSTAHGKVVIITGGTVGIGLDLAEHLLRQGYRLALAGRRAELGRAVASRLDPQGETVIFVQCDVSSYEDQSSLFKEVWEKWKRIDVFVANAGIVDPGSLFNLNRRSEVVDSLPPIPDLSCTEINYKGTIYGVILATHFMRHNPVPGGKIIFTSSTIGIFACPIFPEYSATKAASVALARAMAPVLLHKDNITINVVLPGGYDTGIMPGFKESFLPQHSTTKPYLIKAYDVFLTDDLNKVTGQCVEAGYDKIHFHDMPAYDSGDVAQRGSMIYEPWFSMIHGEPSGVVGALTAPPNQVTGELYERRKA